MRSDGLPAKPATSAAAETRVARLARTTVRLVLVLALVAPLGVLSCYVTQPMIGANTASVQAPAASAQRLASHVRKLSEDFVPRDAGHPRNLEQVAAYIHAEFESAGAVVIDQPFRVDGETYRNVIATFGPRDGERVVVGAHYDAAGEYPGADDNASGVAGLLELARILGAAPPPLRVDLVAYSLEEPPFFRSEWMGSRVHAKMLRESGSAVRAMISLEMIGYFTDAKGSQTFPLSLLRFFYPSEGNFITVVGRFGNASLVRRVKKAMRAGSPLPVHSINAPRSVPGVDFSDHASYWDEGFPAVMLTDTAFYRNPNYHTPDDTPETLDYERMAMVVDGVRAAVIELARR